MIMTPNLILDQFWRQLAAAQAAVLMLDYDGTLAPFRVERNQAVPYPGVREVLADIRAETATRLIIISGRAIDDLVPLLALEPPPEIWGCHGWETLTADGRRPPVDLPAAAADGLRAAGAWLEQAGLNRYGEWKPASLAVHWRGLSDHEANELRNRVAAGWQAAAGKAGLVMHPFDGGLELRCPGRDKGTAVKAILAQSDPGLPVAFLGDDVTDEDGFAALEGVGLGVLVRTQPRATRAGLQLMPPDELLAFLACWRRTAPSNAHLSKGA